MLNRDVTCAVGFTTKTRADVCKSFFTIRFSVSLGTGDRKLERTNPRFSGDLLLLGDLLWDRESCKRGIMDIA